MSHWITAHNGNNEEIAFVSRGAFNPLKIHIYAALDCMDCYAGASGSGQDRMVTRDQLLSAKNYLTFRKELDVEREFVDACLKNLNDKEMILVSFY